MLLHFSFNSLSYPILSTLSLLSPPLSSPLNLLYTSLPPSIHTQFTQFTPQPQSTHQHQHQNQHQYSTIILIPYPLSQRSIIHPPLHSSNKNNNIIKSIYKTFSSPVSSPLLSSYLLFRFPFSLTLNSHPQNSDSNSKKQRILEIVSFIHHPFLLSPLSFHQSLQ